MKLRVLKIVKHKSKRSFYYFYYVFFKSLDNGRSYKTCISEEFRNFNWWRGIKEGDIIEVNDEMIIGNLIDADTIPRVLETK